ncbi:MAG: acyltransferase [Chloroflexota bacterium]
MKRIEALDILRFAAAVLVVGYHYGQDADLGYFKDIFNAFVPPVLTFFFALSGFVLTIAYFDRKGVSARDFYLARFARLAPLYWLALVGIAVLRYGVRQQWVSLFLSATFLQSWFHPFALDYNDVGWAISVEVFFYLTFPLILSLIRASKVTSRVFFWIALAAYLLTQVILIAALNSPHYPGFPSPEYNLLHFSPWPHYCTFLLGISAGWFYLEHRERVLTGPASYAILLSAFALTFVVVQFLPGWLRHSGFRLPINASFYAPLFLGLILAVAFAQNRVTEALGWRPLVMLGAVSYAYFIFQRPFVEAFKFTYELFHLNPTSAFFAVALSLLAFAFLAYYFVEQPAKSLFTKIFKHSA